MSREPWPNGPLQRYERSMLRFLGWLWAALSVLAAILGGVAGSRTVTIYGLGGPALIVSLWIMRRRKPKDGGR